MEEARDSISNTVTEIKETVAQQVETVKDALDWREHFKRRPVAWSLGALGVGFCAGYGIAAAIKGEPSAEDAVVPSTAHAYASQPILGPSQPEAVGNVSTANGDKDEGPSLLERFRETSAYERLGKEVASLGDRLIEELSSTAHKVVLPAVLLKLKNWIGLDLSEDRSQESATRPGRGSQSASTQPNRSSVYEPILERSS
jgi:hypothetical protein